MTNRITTPDDLSPRDIQLLDLFAAGTSRADLARRFEISTERVGAIVRRPASLAYLAQRAAATRTLLYAKVGEELLSRLDWGSVRMVDAIALLRVVMPQELNVNLAVAEAARIVAERRGLTPEQTGLIVDLATRRKAS